MQYCNNDLRVRHKQWIKEKGPSKGKQLPTKDKKKWHVERTQSTDNGTNTMNKMVCTGIPTTGDRTHKCPETTLGLRTKNSQGKGRKR